MIIVENISVSFRIHYHSVGGLGQWVATLAHVASGKPLDRYTALKEVSFEVPDGKVMGIIGPNGAGKSTLLRVIAGVYPPDSGGVYLSGKVSSLLSLGTGFNNALSARENIEIAGLLNGVPPSRIPEMVDTVIEFGELEEFKDVSVQYYSAGMYSRLGFGVVLFLQPEILLIDEVFSVGDLAFQKKANQAMQDLRAKSRAQVLVSHDLSLIEEECDLAMLLVGGEVRAIGKPAEVVREYRGS